MTAKKSSSDGHGFATRCVHGGQRTDTPHGAVNTPLQLSTTFVQPDVAKPVSYDYSRGGNTNRAALEETIADLEGGKHGFAFASGLAAMDTVLRDLVPGDHVVCAEDAYGGTIRLLRQVAARDGIDVTFVDTRDREALAEAFTDKSRWLLLETPTNPLLRVTDIDRAAQTAHDRGAKVLVDNTFMTPAMQNPLALGADVVLHSATKALGGHTDVLAGLLVTNEDGLAERLRFLQMAVGAVLPPFDCHLLLRGIRTLHLRTARQAESAALLAERLQGHPAVEAVFYPGLADHPGHEVQARQARSGGSMISIRLADGEAARQVVRATKVFLLAESLGAVESLIQVPAAMTHASVPKEMREATGLTDGLVRLSVGIEHVDDLWADLEQALAQAAA